MPQVSSGGIEYRHHWKRTVGFEGLFRHMNDHIPEGRRASGDYLKNIACFCRSKYNSDEDRFPQDSCQDIPAVNLYI